MKTDAIGIHYKALLTHNMRFHGEIRKTYQYFEVEQKCLIQAILYNYFTFIGHKSKKTQIDILIIQIIWLAY